MASAAKLSPATNSKLAKSGFYFGVGCPGCGGELELDSDFVVTTCPHCGSVLRIVMPNTPPAYLIKSKLLRHEVLFHLDRHLKANSLPLTQPGQKVRAIYYPYWKVDAIGLKLRTRIERRWETTGDAESEAEPVEIKKSEITLSRYMTTAQAGPAVDGIPESIGLRAEYMKLYPFSGDHLEEEFETTEVTVQWEQILPTLKKRAEALSTISGPSPRESYTDLCNPSGSVVYFPYFIVTSGSTTASGRFVIDGLSGRVVGQSRQRQEEDDFKTDSESGNKWGSLKVELHRCSNCGADLPSRQSYVYHCQNCQQFIFLDKGATQLREIKVVAGEHKHDGSLFPFWLFKLPPSLPAEFKVFGSDFRQVEQLVIPAFKLSNFESCYRLARRITSAFSKLTLNPMDNFDVCYLPVTVSITEAAVLASVVISREHLTRGRTGSGNAVSIPLEGVSLFYAPFHQENYFYVDSHLGAITFESKGLQ